MFVTKINNNIMETGKVKFFNNAKGFGFIKDSNSEKEYFVHASGCVSQIKEGDEVTFELEEGKKGVNAVNVRVA
jgi:cold shock protein